MHISQPDTPQIGKPLTHSSHRHCSGESASKGNPCLTLIWFIHVPLLQGRSFITVFRREEQTCTGVSKVIKENCEVAGVGSQNQYHIPYVLLSVSVVLQSSFYTLLPPIPPAKLFSICKRPG